MNSKEPDYYALLGVGRGASATDVGRAYRRAARATHPDIHPDDASAAERFRAVTIAYETLSDPVRRASYDNNHPSVSPGAAIRIAVYRRQSTAVPPVHLGPRRPRAEPLHGLSSSARLPVADDLFDSSRRSRARSSAGLSVSWHGQSAPSRRSAGAARTPQQQTGRDWIAALKAS